MDDSTKRAIRELLGARSRLLVDQSQLLANGHKLATQLLTELFRATPALTSVRIRFEFEWGDQDGMPVRRSLPMPVLKLDAGALQNGVLTTLTQALMADDPLDADDMEIQLSSHLEEMNFFEAIGSLLDAGQASASIELDRARALAPAEDTRVPAPHYH